MHPSARALAAIVSLALAFSFTSVAHADDTTNSVVAKALSRTSPTGNATETPLNSLAHLAGSSSSKSYAVYFEDKASIEIPTLATSKVKFTSRQGAAISVGLPFSGRAKQALAISTGALAFDNSNESTTAVMAKSDGSLQIATVIRSSNAPTQYAYTLNLPAGVQANLVANGGVAFMDAGARYIGGAAPAWAKDALGISVPTHYELSGSTLTQVVDHKDMNYAYPIVADPWLGFDMIDHTTWTKTSPLSPTLSVFPTPWGHAIAFATTYPFSSGLLALTDQFALDAAWAETLQKTARAGQANPNTSTMYVQFECHFFWVSKKLPLKQSWNLDALRPYASMPVQFLKECNVN